MKRQQQQLVAVAGILTTTSLLALLAYYWHQKRKAWLAKGPRAAKKSGKVLFGKVEGPTRGPDSAKLIDPPVEKEDPYYWLRDDTRKNKEILRYIKEENSYTKAMTSNLKKFKKEIYNDLLKHLKQTDQEFPYLWGPFFYYSRTEEGKAYKIYCRKASLDQKAEETVLLNPNEISKKEGYKYFDLGAYQPSPDHTILAYSIDTTGYETYDIHFKDIKTESPLKDVIKETAGGVCWGADNSVVYYEKMDDTHRPYQLWRHVMGTSCDDDVMLFEEKDDRLWMHTSKTDSERFLIMTVGGKIMNESHLIDLQGAKGAEDHASRSLVLIEPRSEENGGHRYSVEHQGDHLYIITNKDGSLNSKLTKTSVSQLRAVNWVDCFPYDKAVKLDYLTVFKNYIVINGRQHGFAQSWVFDSATTGSRHRIDQPEPVYAIYSSHNAVFDTEVYRYEYSSPITPKCTFEYNLKTRERKLLKQTEVPHYDSSQFACERLEATAADGTKVPISFMYSKKLFPDRKAPKPAPMLLYGYGSYGACIDPSFDSNRIVLLERGMSFAIGHIRGGGEMGRQWYEKEGKLKTKMNTFTDFIACAEGLIKMKLTTADSLAIMGASAGGLLIGASVNIRGSDLFKVAILDVPFVDVLCTMCDSTVPLTAVEWEEWGNPNELEYLEYMSKYSPVDNITAKAYPSMLVTGGLWDPRVQYFEPVKWVAKLRELKTDNNPLLLKIDMSSGHFSASDRYKYLEEKAFAYSFMLDQLGLGPKS